MSQRKESQERNRRFWRPLVEKFESSEGLTQKEFAQHHGLKVTTFRYWLYQLRKEKSQDGEKPVPVRFVELEVEPPDVAGVNAVVDLGAVQMHLDTLPDPRWLAELAACVKGGRTC